MTNNENKPMGRVGLAAEAMREMTVPSGPSEELILRTIAGSGAGAGDVIGGHKEKEWWKMKMVRRSAAAAGVVVMVTFGLLWLVWGRGASVAFADVVEQMKQVQAARCKVVLDTAVPGQNPKSVVEDMLMVDPGWVIAEVRNSGTKVVMNDVEGKMLMLMEKSPKQAMRIDLVNAPASQRMPNLLDMFRKMGGAGARPLGEREIDGVKTKGFSMMNGNTNVELWADVKTERPVLVTMKVSTGMLGVSLQYAFSDFDWQPAYDPSELSLDVPAGYALATSKMDMSEPKEADVVVMLQSIGELNDGTFPAGIGMKDLMPVLQNLFKAHAAATQNGKARTPNPMAYLGMQKMMTVGRGWGYMKLPAKGSDWHYAGSGVSVGEKGRIVLWYKPAATEGWRAFDADFAVHDASDSELPKDGVPVKLDLPVGAVMK